MTRKSGHQGQWWDKNGQERLAAFHRVPSGQIAIYYLATWPFDIINRRTIRALIPGDRGVVRHGSAKRARNFAKGDSGGGSAGDRISVDLKSLYRSLERHGLIDRGQEFIRIIDRPGLLARYGEGDVDHLRFAEGMRQALRVIADEINVERRPNVVELRRRELKHIQSLIGDAR
jgi:hypothetical protein